VVEPIAKKRGAKKVEEHRGVTLMPTAYKVYGVSRKAEKSDKGERHVIGGADGVQEGKGVMDIYTLNYVVEKEIARGNKVVATFVDLKAAFDSVDRVY